MKHMPPGVVLPAMIAVSIVEVPTSQPRRLFWFIRNGGEEESLKEKSCK
jgi:hypothetical protein